jgi:hypothetical protein
VGEVWSKAVIGATLATAALLPLLGVPLLGDRGALYRAMGVLTAGEGLRFAMLNAGRLVGVHVCVSV